MSDETKSAGGRKSSYKPEYAETARKLCEQFGATDQQLAIHFDVTRKTIENWKANFAEFSLALEVGKEPADDRVERALYLRAIGYDYLETKVFHSVDGGIVTHDVIRHVPPDVRACQHWLFNRRRDRWLFRLGSDAGPDEDTPAPEAVKVRVIDGESERVE